MACKDSGKIISVSGVESGTSAGTGKDWRKVEFAIEWGDKFKNQLCLTAFNDKVDQVQNLSVGDNVTVEYTANSRPWTKDGVTKWFHNINLVSVNIDVDGGNQTYTANSTGLAQNAPDENDLPF